MPNLMWICKLCGLAAPQSEWLVELNEKGGVVRAVCPHCPKPERQNSTMVSYSDILKWMEGV